MEQDTLHSHAVLFEESFIRLEYRVNIERRDPAYVFFFRWRVKMGGKVGKRRRRRLGATISRRWDKRMGV